MFQITANSAAKAAFELAHETRGTALRRAVEHLFSRPADRAPKAHPAE